MFEEVLFHYQRQGVVTGLSLIFQKESKMSSSQDYFDLYHYIACSIGCVYSLMCSIKSEVKAKIQFQVEQCALRRKMERNVRLYNTEQR